MNTMKKILALVLVLGLLFVSAAIPASAGNEVLYPNTETFSWGVNGHGAYGSYGSTTVDQQLALAAKLGAKLYRVDIGAVSELDRVDDIVMAANTYGMDVMLCMTCRQPDASSLASAGANTTQLVKDYRSIARHFKTGDFGRVKYFEIFNERESTCKANSDSDINYAAGYDDAKITSMYNCMNAARSAIKAEIPDAQIVINYGYLHDPFIQLLAAKGLAFDVIDLHWYDNMEDDFENGLEHALDRLDAVDSLSDKPVIIGEMGYINGNSTIGTLLPTMMQRAYNSDKVIGAIFYELLDYGNDQGYGLADSTGTVKSIYTDIQAMIGGSNDVTPGTYVRSANAPTGVFPSKRRAVLYETGKSVTCAGNANRVTFPSYSRKDDLDNIDFDVYIETDPSITTATFYIGFKCGDDYHGSCWRTVTFATNQWVHDNFQYSFYDSAGGKIADFDFDDITAFSAEAMDPNHVINIENITFTNRAATKNNVYSEVVSDSRRWIRQPGDYGFSMDGAQNNPSHGVDITGAEYVEFDIMCETNSSTAKLGNFNIYCSWQYDVYLTYYIGELEPNAWTHMCIPLSEFTKVGVGDFDYTMLHETMIQSTSEFCSQGHSMCNLSFTKEVFPWGDANGDDEINIKDLVCMKKALANEESLDYCDFDDSGDIDAPDLGYLRQYLLGIIDSLDPEDIFA